MRQAVDAGDAGRVVSFYKGFIAEAGHHALAGQQRSYQSRQSATGAKPVWTREQVRQAYERRRLGGISDAAWAKQEAEIIAAANQGRIAGSLDRDGNKLTELRR
jgi:hypothetical protein